jgi:hypothetical protein
LIYGLDVVGIKIPSENGIAYQFCPWHPLHVASLNCIGALNITHKVQARILRANHPDSNYVATVFKMTMCLGVAAAQVTTNYTDEEEASAFV